MEPTAGLAAFVHNGLSLETASEEATQAAKLLVLDTVGVSLAATTFPVGRKIISYVEAQGGAEVAPVIGGTRRVPAPLAALANGTLASALDFDEGFHVPTYVLPAALAVGAEVRASGAAVLEAVIAGYEAGERLRSALDARREDGKGLTYRGWYHVGIVGPIAAALTAGKLLGLERGALVHAIGMASAGIGGLRRNFGTMAKAYQAGSAASAGVHAACLAGRGFTADSAILEGELGLEYAVCRPGECNWAGIGDAGRATALEGALSVKRFPACTPAHPAVASLLELKDAEGLRAEDVVEVRVQSREFSLRRPDAADETEAGFSLPYLLAVALVDGDVGLDQIEDGRLFDPEVRAVFDRVRMIDGPPAARAEVAVRLRDGRVVVAQEGAVPYLTSREAVVAKYRACALRVWAWEHVETLFGRVMSLEALDDIGVLVDRV